MDTAKANVEEKKTLLQVAEATTEYRLATYKRPACERLSSIDQDVVDEAKKNLGVPGPVNRPPKLPGSRPRGGGGREEFVKVKEAAYDVARVAYKAAQALAEYARVKAPWDGTVVDRHVDPGSFVQNASTGHPTPLVTLERTDIVTVIMRVPTTSAPFVKTGTEATLELDELPGVKDPGPGHAHCSVAGDDHRDRTMRVEVDLWNSDPSKYAAFLAAHYDGDKPRAGTNVKDGLPPLLPTFTGEDVALHRSHAPAGRHVRQDDPGPEDLYRQQPGPRAWPSFTRWSEIMYVVEQGKAHRVPIKVQVDDGNLAKVVLLDGKGRVQGDLTGKEEVVSATRRSSARASPWQRNCRRTGMHSRPAIEQSPQGLPGRALERRSQPPWRLRDESAGAPHGAWRFAAAPLAYRCVSACSSGFRLRARVTVLCRPRNGYFRLVRVMDGGGAGVSPYRRLGHVLVGRLFGCAGT